MSMDCEGYYAHTRWHPEDVQALKPKWSLKKCEAWLSKNETNISDRLVEYGWGVMEALMDDESSYA